MTIDKKEKILKALRENGELSATNVATITRGNPGYTKIYLDELKEECKVTLKERHISENKSYTYWSLK